MLWLQVTCFDFTKTNKTISTSRVETSEEKFLKELNKYNYNVMKNHVLII